MCQEFLNAIVALEKFNPVQYPDSCSIFLHFQCQSKIILISHIQFCFMPYHNSLFYNHPANHLCILVPAHLMHILVGLDIYYNWY